MKKYFVVSAVIFFASSHSHAASFDCGKASNYAEKSICTDNRLSKLDDALSENYKTMSGSYIGDGARKDLKSTQRAWLSSRNKCSDIECLVSSYKKRIDDICEYPVLSGIHPTCKSSEELEAELSLVSKPQQQSTATTLPPQKQNIQPQTQSTEKTTISAYGWTGTYKFGDNTLSVKQVDQQSAVIEVRKNSGFFQTGGFIKGVLPLDENQRGFLGEPSGNCIVSFAFSSGAIQISAKGDCANRFGFDSNGIYTPVNKTPIFKH